MFLAAIRGYDKKTGREVLAVGKPRETHGDIFCRVGGRLDIDDINGFVDSKTLKYHTRKAAAAIAEEVTGNEDMDFESSESYIELRDKC
jgi:hypothetical protein